MRFRRQREGKWESGIRMGDEIKKKEDPTRRYREKKKGRGMLLLLLLLLLQIKTPKNNTHTHTQQQQTLMSVVNSILLPSLLRHLP